MMDRIWVVLQKEIIDNFRDRRALVSSLIGTLIGPGLMLLLFFVIGRTVEVQSEQTLRLPIIGGEYAPNLVQFLSQHNIEIVDAPENPEAAVRVGDYDVVLVIDAGFGEDLANGRPATVKLIVDDSRQSSGLPVARLENMLEAYQDTVVSLRLISRGVSPIILDPLAVETIDVATPQSSAAQLLGMLPYFLIFSVFIGGMHLAIDTTAGGARKGVFGAVADQPDLSSRPGIWETGCNDFFYSTLRNRYVDCFLGDVERCSIGIIARHASFFGLAHYSQHIPDYAADDSARGCAAVDHCIFLKKL